MSGVNKAIIIGHLGRDVEMRYTTGGDAVANINVATSETWKDKAGEKQERTEWHRLVAFGKTAELAGQYLKKGSQAYFEGRIETKKYEKDGVEKYSTQIVVEKMTFLGGGSGGSRENGDAEPAQPTRRAPPKAAPAAQNSLDDDIPF